MLTLERVSKSYKVGLFGGTDLPAVRDVSFSLQPGEVISLIGESGSGKSTIGKMILRLLSVNDGTITHDGTDIATLRGAALRSYYRTVQGVFQDPFSSFNPIFKADHVFGLIRGVYFGTASAADWRRRVDDALEAVTLDPAQVLHKYPHQLSGGQLQRLLIARALLLDTRYLVADEIISMLDASTRIDVLNLLGDLKARGLGILFITHDLSLGNYISERTVILRRGRIVEIGATPAVFGRPLHPYTRMLIASVPQLHQKWGEMEAGSRAGTGWAPAPTEPCRYHAALPGGGATAVPTGLAGSGLAEVEDGHFVGCVQPNDDGTCGGRPASSS
jgi:ABC-type oligopeptide transport system ATPase subunit